MAGAAGGVSRMELDQQPRQPHIVIPQSHGPVTQAVRDGIGAEDSDLCTVSAQLQDLEIIRSVLFHTHQYRVKI